jgi:hypothetical protein
VKLGNDESDICAVLPEAYGVEAMESRGFLSGINGWKWVTKTWKMMKEVQDITEPL